MKYDFNKPVEEIIVKSQNRLVSSKFRYTQCQLDLLFYILHIVKDNEKNYSFPIKNIVDLTGRRYDSSDLCKQTQDLTGKVFSVYGNSDEQWSHIALFQKISYDYGVVTVILNDIALELFKQTRAEFSYIELKSGLMLNKKHEKRLYWLLSQWRSVGSKEYSFDELREYFNLVGKNAAYERACDFKLLITEACRNISKITDLKVKPVWRKTGRSYTSVLFDISSSRNLKSSSDESDIDYQLDEKEAKTRRFFVSHGISEEDALEMWNRGCREEDFNKIVSQISKVDDKSKIDNLQGYLIQCLRNAGYLKNDKKDLKEKIAENQRRLFGEKRSEMIQLIKEALAQGEKMGSFMNMMKKFNINEADLTL